MATFTTKQYTTILIVTAVILILLSKLFLFAGM